MMDWPPSSQDSQADHESQDDNEVRRPSIILSQISSRSEALHKRHDRKVETLMKQSRQALRLVVTREHRGRLCESAVLTL